MPEGLEPERARRLNREIRGGVVDRIHAAMLVTDGTRGAMTKEKIRESLDFILDESIRHPEHMDQDYFWGSGGFIVYVRRDAQRGYWDTYQVFISATGDQIEYQVHEEPQ
jgi:hypothetical protein